jgi:hypothetical protein
MQITRLPAFLHPEVFPYTSVEIVREVVIVPLTEGPVVDVALGHILDEQDVDDEQPEPDDEDCGRNCGSACGFCGRCS